MAYLPPLILLVLLLAQAIFMFVALYHLIRFGVGSLPKLLAAVYLTGSVLLMMVFGIFFLAVDFSAVLPL